MSASTQMVASFDTGLDSQRIMGQTEAEAEAEVEGPTRDLNGLAFDLYFVNSRIEPLCQDNL